jgi:4-amino-4-deoxy-L-arabinose transferase-like glycosyltransferase
MRSFAHGARGLVLLHLNGQVYTQKPPLYYWIAAAFGAPGGRVTETAARLPSALAGVATVALVFAAGRSLFRARTGLLAACALLTLPGYVQMARSARLDALLTAFVTAALFAAWRLGRGIGDGSRNRIALHAALGLGVLTKVPVAILLRGLGIVAWLAFERRLSDLRRFVSVPALVLSLGPGIAWAAAAVALAPAGYAGDALWENVVRRFFAGTAHRRGPLYYLTQFPAGFLPWTLVWPLAALRARAVARTPGLDDERSAWRFVLAIVAAAVLFLSLSAGKRGVYLLPVYPLAAIGCAEGLRAWIEDPRPLPRWLRSAVCALGTTLALAGLATLVRDRFGAVRVSPAFGPAVALVVVAGILLEHALRLRTRRKLALVGATLATLVALEALVFLALFPAVDPEKSLRASAEAAGAVTPAGEPIGLLGNAEMIGGIAYYGHRPVTELRDAADVGAFLEAGGAAIVVEEKDLPRLGGGVRLRTLESARSGERRILVLGRPDDMASETPMPREDADHSR